MSFMVIVGTNVNTQLNDTIVFNESRSQQEVIISQTIEEPLVSNSSCCFIEILQFQININF